MQRVTPIIILLSAVLGGWPLSAWAGANNAKFQCQGKSSLNQSLTLSGSIPGDFSDFELRLQNKSGAIVMNQVRDKINVIAAFDRRVFTMAVTLADGRNLLLYAIPTSVKAKGGQRREVKASFDAILLEAPKPGVTGNDRSSIIRDVPLRCSFNHST
jgi:hypothetical protein